MKPKIFDAVLAIILTAILYSLSSCNTLKETYKTENGITIHTIGSGPHSKAYLIVKQQKPTSHE